MISIKLKNLLGSAECKTGLYRCKDAFIPITYNFEGGNIYGLISDFGQGSWGLATCLGGRGKIIDGSVYLNDKMIDLEDLTDFSCFVGETNFTVLQPIDGLVSAKNCIEKALLTSKLPFSIQDIKSQFHISEERFERDIRFASSEIWRISAAIGFALNKQIFCYPWLNTHDAVVALDEAVLNILRKNRKIVLIPACRTFVKSPYRKDLDQIIDFHAYEKPYFNLSPEDRKKLKMVKKWW